MLLWHSIGHVNPKASACKTILTGRASAEGTRVMVLRIGLAVAVLVAAPLAAVSTASASTSHNVTPVLFSAKDEGFGPTLASAEQNARTQINADYGPCEPPYYYYADGQYSDGTWRADVTAECTAYH
jgi:hypothetical protein